MSIHVQISDEAKEALDKQKKQSTLFSLLISLATIGALAGLLTILTIIIPSKEVETIISYKAPTVEPDDSTTEPTIQQQVRTTPQPPAAASAVANVITSTAPSSFSVPDTNIFTTSESDNFGSSDNFADSFGSDPTGAGFTAFGSTDATGLVGFIFDIKQTDKQKKSKLGEIYDRGTKLRGRIGQFQKDEKFQKIKSSGYTFDSFDDFYKGEQSLNFTFLVVDNVDATTGPEAFGAGEEIAPSAWVAVYEGVFAEAPRKPFRFSGLFDDILIVYINDKVVFDGSWQNGYTDYFDESESYKQGGDKNMRVAGSYISPKVGDKIRIVVGEVPGGLIGGGLFIEEEGRDTVRAPIPFTSVPIEGEVREILEAKVRPMTLDDVPVFRFSN